MTIRSIILLAGTLCAGTVLSTPAFAEGPTGFYGTLRLGAASVDNIATTAYQPAEVSEPEQGEFARAAMIPAGSDTAEGRFKLDTAFAISGSIGYDFGLIRVDAEMAYSENKVKSFTLDRVNGSPVTLSSEDAGAVCGFIDADNCSVSGNTVAFDGEKLRQFSAMGNVWVDIPVGGKFEPYVGGGIGIAVFDIADEAKSSFAWQIGAGVAYHLTDHVAVTADVRHRQADSIAIAFDETSGINFGRVKTWNYGLGLRYTF